MARAPTTPAPEVGGLGGRYERRAIADLTPAGYNPRTIGKKALKGLQASLREFGLVQPVVWNKRTGTVVGGHQRLKALAAAGETHVDVVVVDLPLEREKALNLALNSEGIQGDWTTEALAMLDELHASMPDLSASLLMPDLTKMLQRQFHIEPPAAKDPDVPAVPKTPTTKAGDVWTLGRHRVACGDSRDPKVLAAALAGGQADVLWTDPPYGISYESVGRVQRARRLGVSKASCGVKPIQNDGSAGLGSFLGDLLASLDSSMRPGARFYIAAPARPQGTEFRIRIAEIGWTLHQVLVWVKDRFVLGHSDYHYRHEDVLYGWKPGKGRLGRGRHEGTRWYGGNDRDTVFEIPRPARSDEHPTMKPVELVVQHLRCSAKEGDVVLDPCGGSGTTLLAAEALGLPSAVVELSPGYVDVIVQRWEESTGGKAKRG